MLVLDVLITCTRASKISMWRVSWNLKNAKPYYLLRSFHPFTTPRTNYSRLRKKSPSLFFQSESPTLSFSFGFFPHTRERCGHGIGCTHLHPINPKYPNAVEESGGSFLKAPGIFMVTDELVVKPLWPFSGVTLVSNSNIPLSDLEERTVNVDARKVNILKKFKCRLQTVYFIC